MNSDIIGEPVTGPVLSAWIVEDESRHARASARYRAVTGCMALQCSRHTTTVVHKRNHDETIRSSCRLVHVKSLSCMLMSANVSCAFRSVNNTS